MRRSIPLGTVLRLVDDIGEISAGLYVLTALDGLATIHWLGRNEDGELSPGGTGHRITLTELEQFYPMKCSIPFDTD